MFQFIRSIRFALPVTTSHREAWLAIEHQRKQIERTICTTRYSARLRDRLVEVREGFIEREQRILDKPNQWRFPIFFSFSIGKNFFGLSFAGLRCNFPILAQRYGTECEYAGNTKHYRNWLGHHWDF